MIPQVYPLQVYRGDTMRWSVACYSDTAQATPSDLTGVRPRAQIRDRPGGWLCARLTCTVDANQIMVELPHWESRYLPMQAAWDLELTLPGGAVTTVVTGIVAVAPDITERLWK